MSGWGTSGPVSGGPVSSGPFSGGDYVDPAPSHREMSPPLVLACGSVAFGVVSVLLSFFLHGSAGWIGWIIGFLGIVAGIAYRTRSRTSERNVDYRADYRIDRLMLVGVFVSVAGVGLNAWVIAQRVAA